MRTVEVKRHIEAPRSDVWAVLADFPNIASWNGGVKNSFSTSDATDGVGAKQHCNLAPMGALEETVQGWEPEARMEISIDSAEGLPIRAGLATDRQNKGPIRTRVKNATTRPLRLRSGRLCVSRAPLIHRWGAAGRGCCRIPPRLGGLRRTPSARCGREARRPG